MVINVRHPSILLFVKDNYTGIMLIMMILWRAIIINITLPTPLVTVKPVRRTLSSLYIQYLYISCYVTANKLVLSYLLLCLLPQHRKWKRDILYRRINLLLSAQQVANPQKLVSRLDQDVQHLISILNTVNSIENTRQKYATRSR